MTNTTEKLWHALPVEGRREQDIKFGDLAAMVAESFFYEVLVRFRVEHAASLVGPARAAYIDQVAPSAP